MRDYNREIEGVITQEDLLRLKQRLHEEAERLKKVDMQVVMPIVMGRLLPQLLEMSFQEGVEMMCKEVGVVVKDLYDVEMDDIPTEHIKMMMNQTMGIMQQN